MNDVTTITVTGEPGYDITVGTGILHLVGEALPATEIGRASCRERVCMSV